MAYHVGQIVYLAKHFAGPKWNSLTVPRGKSAEFNAKVASGKTSSARVKAMTDFEHFLADMFDAVDALTRGADICQ